MKMTNQLRYETSQDRMGVGQKCWSLPIGVDCYNQQITGSVAKTMTSKATDSDHIPCVVVQMDEKREVDRFHASEDVLYL